MAVLGVKEGVAWRYSSPERPRLAGLHIAYKLVEMAEYGTRCRPKDGSLPWPLTAGGSGSSGLVALRVGSGLSPFPSQTSTVDMGVSTGKGSTNGHRWDADGVRCCTRMELPPLIKREGVA